MKRKFYYKGRMFRHFSQLKTYYFSKTGSQPTRLEKVKACDGGTILAYH